VTLFVLERSSFFMRPAFFFLVSFKPADPLTPPPHHIPTKEPVHDFPWLSRSGFLRLPVVCQRPLVPNRMVSIVTMMFDTSIDKGRTFRSPFRSLFPFPFSFPPNSHAGFLSDRRHFSAVRKILKTLSRVQSHHERFHLSFVDPPPSVYAEFLPWLSDLPDRVLGNFST